MLERQESGKSAHYVAAGTELVGRRVMVGNPAYADGR